MIQIYIYSSEVARHADIAVLFLRKTVAIKNVCQDALSKSGKQSLAFLREGLQEIRLRAATRWYLTYFSMAL